MSITTLLVIGLIGTVICGSFFSYSSYLKNKIKKSLIDKDGFVNVSPFTITVTVTNSPFTVNAGRSVNLQISVSKPGTADTEHLDCGKLKVGEVTFYRDINFENGTPLFILLFKKYCLEVLREELELKGYQLNNVVLYDNDEVFNFI